jgi:putative transposase
MSYDALRRGRYSQSHQSYCITTVTRERLPVFEDLASARLLIWELRRLHEAGFVRSLAWVVMPDHLHWLIQLNECWSLCKVMKTLKARSARSINRYRCQQGSLWQRSYYDRALRKEDSMLTIARYIVANPLRAGLVVEIGSYPHWDCIWMMEGDRTPLVE